MLVVSQPEIEARIGDVVRSIVAQNGRNVAISLDDRLADVGLTSMDMVGLMLGIEAAFDMTIPQADITPENFLTIGAIKRMVCHQMTQAQAA